MKKENKYVTVAKYTKEKRGDIKIKEKEILGRLNEENEHNLEEINMMDGPIE